MRQRVIGRSLQECHEGGGYDLVRRPLGNGHWEYLLTPMRTWVEVALLSDRAAADRLACVQETEEERKLANLERAAKRAKCRVRHLCKAGGVDTLLTLTYAENMRDWGTLKRHMKEFNRRMSRIIVSVRPSLS